MSIGALYVHAPFCARKCSYCDFASEATRVKAVKNDALKMAGDDSYQIDIGV